MDIIVETQEDFGQVFRAISARAQALFEERFGDHVHQFFCHGNPEDVLSKLPDEWHYQAGVPSLHLVS